MSSMKKILSIIIATILFANSLAVIAEEPLEEDVLKIYVSVDGNDENPGTKEAPLKTLEGARIKARAEKREKPIEVIFGGGEYRFIKGVNFDDLDSGTENAPVTYKAAEGEKVTFKGSFEFSAEEGQYVGDKDILSRVDVHVRNRLVQYDLKKLGYTYGLPVTNKIQQFLFLMYPKESEYVNLFLDDKEQTLSEWPNGDDEFVAWVEAVEKGGTIDKPVVPGSFKYSGSRPNRWTKADSFWIGGYPGYNYRYERNSVGNVDTENSIITLATNTCFGLISEESKAWKVFNLLEEIDMPGEWYIDKNTMMLYYYMPYSLKDKTLEISFLDEPFFNLKGASYINIEGIDFTQHRSTAVLGTVVSNINVDGCTFKNIDGTAVKTQGDKRTTYSYSRWQNAATEFHVRNCTFDNIGGSAILLEGGNIDTLERGNCSFENNMIMRASIKAKNQEAIVLQGVGNTVKNNSLSSVGFHAITYRGSYHTINNNEFYDTNKSSDDAGVVYAGRDYAARGTEMAYNYIHDNAAHRNISRGYTIAFYWDDAQPGQNAHHNIIVNNPWAVNSSGHDNYFDNNTIINSTKENIKFYDRNGWAMGAQHTALLADKDVYFEHFPDMQETLDEKYKGKQAFCSVTGNLSVNSAENIIENLVYSKEENNIEVDECIDFVDPANQDYRLKSDSETAKKMPGVLDESFDINEIGIVGRDYVFNEETAPFNKMYPHDGQGAINVNEIEFMWERVFGANNYRLVIAKDKELTDVVYDEVVPYHINKISGLQKNTTYYWQVWANNTSRQFASEWQSVGEPMSFTTSVYSKVDKLSLQNVVKNSEERLLRSVEGENAGQFKPGSLDEVRKYLLKSNIFLNMGFGKVEQEEIDEVQKNIENFWADTNKINPGHIDMLSIASSVDDWKPAAMGGFDAEGKFVVTSKTSGIIYAEEFKNYTENCIIKFKTKINTKNWVAFGMISKDVMPYASNNTSYFMVIKNDIIELQENPGGGSKIIEIKDIHIANDGKYHEIEFGAVRLNAGRALTAKVDGEVLFEYVDTTPVDNKLFPMFYVTNGDTFEICKSEKETDISEYKELIERSLPVEAVKIHDEYNQVAAEDLVILKNGTNLALKDAGLQSLPEDGYVLNNDKNYISKEVADGLFGVLDYSGVSSAVIKGVEMYPLSELVKANKLRVDYDDVTRLIFISSSGMKDNLTNMVARLRTTAKFFDGNVKRQENK